MRTMTLWFDDVLWGMDPAGYHLTNLLLHSANAVLVYFIAVRIFAAADSESGNAAREWQAFAGCLATLLFRFIPCVESVAWGDRAPRYLVRVLFLAEYSLIPALERRCRETIVRGRARGLRVRVALERDRGHAASDTVRRKRLSAAQARRSGGWRSDDARRVYRELAPFAVLSILAGTLAIVALPRLDQLGPIDKLIVSAYGLAFYVWKTIAPVNLSPLYAMPDPVERGAVQFVVAAVAVIALGALAWISRKRWPAVPAAWIAFVVAVFPLLGLVQNGPQIAADRYTYFAGPAVALLAAAALVHFARPRIGVGIAAAALITLGALTWRQTRVWHDSETLWAQVLRIEPDSPIARNN